LYCQINLEQCNLTELITKFYPYLAAAVVLSALALVIIFGRHRRSSKKNRPASMQEDFIHSIFDNSPQAILVVDSAGRLLEVNATALHLTGFQHSRLLNQSIKILAPSLELEKQLQEAVAPFSRDVELTLQSGEQLPYVFFFSPFTFEGHSYYTVLMRSPRDLNAVEASSRRALDVIQSRMDELSTIRRVSENLNQATTLRGALSPVLETIRAITKSASVWVFLPDDTGITSQRIDYDPLSDGSPLRFSSVSNCDYGCIASLLAGELENPQTISACDCPPQTDPAKRITSHYTLPLYLGKKPIGLLNFLENPQHPVTENRLDILHTICDSLSVALERVRLFATEHEQRKLAETLADIGTNLTKTLDLSEVLDLLLDQVKRLVPYDGANIMFIQENIARIERINGYSRVSPEEFSQFEQIALKVDTTQNLQAISKELKTKIISDVAQDANWIPSPAARHYHSWMGSPVLIDGKMEMIFSLEKEEPGFYNAHHAELLATFCAQAALAIKNARLYSGERRRIQELDALQDTLISINSELDLTLLLKQIVARAIALLNADVGELALFEPENNFLRITVSENMDRSYVGTPVHLGEGLMGLAAQTLTPQTVSNYAGWENSMPQYKDLVPHAGLAIPMVAGPELFGVVAIGDVNLGRQFSKDDIRLLESFAQQAIIAIQNARLFQDARKRAEEAEKLSRAGSAVAATLNQDEAIARILEQLSFVIPYDSASVLLKKDENLVIVGGHGFKEINSVLGLQYELNAKNPGAIVFLENSPLVVNNVAADFPSFMQLPQSQSTIRSWMGAPLTIKGKPIGILSLDAHEFNRFTSEHVRLVTAFADQVSIALENARLYTEEVNAGTRFKTLYEFGQTISAVLNLEDMYPVIFDAVKKLMKTEYFSIALVDRERATIRDVFIYDRNEPIELQERDIEMGLFGKVIKEGKPRLWHYFTQEMVKDTGAVLVGNDLDSEEISQSIIIVPLRTRTGVVGAISAQSYTPNMYSDVDMEAMELLGANAAVAIENAQLFNKMQNMAITDELTGLFNRRRFFEMATQEFERSKRYNHPLSVIMLDIDHFKRVNDTYGHAIGDQVLQGLAGVVSTNLRQVDILARYGGEEFAVMLPETRLEDALITAERLRQKTAEATIPTRVGNMSITISLGVVTQDKTCRSLEELLDRSDQALYACKRTGRNKVSPWRPEYAAQLPGTGPLPTIKTSQLQ
jgi:diguanylate cyclase (GGDEF)-like protein